MMEAACVCVRVRGSECDVYEGACVLKAQLMQHGGPGSIRCAEKVNFETKQIPCDLKTIYQPLHCQYTPQKQRCTDEAPFGYMFSKDAHTFCLPLFWE